MQRSRRRVSPPSKGCDWRRRSNPREGVVDSWWCTGWLTAATVGAHTRYSPILIGASAYHAGVRDAGRCVPFTHVRKCVRNPSADYPADFLRRPWPLLFLEPSPKKRPRPENESSKVLFLKDCSRNLLDLRGKYISVFSLVMFNYAYWFYDYYIGIILTLSLQTWVTRVRFKINFSKSQSLALLYPS